MDTFVVRLWMPAEPTPEIAVDPRGVVRHIASGRTATFRDGDQLLALLRELPQPSPAVSELPRAPSDRRR